KQSSPAPARVRVIEEKGSQKVETYWVRVSSLDVIISQLKILTILGSTGSIGVSTLDVVGRHPEQYHVHALVAGNNTGLLMQQILKFRPLLVVNATEQSRESLTKRLSESALPRREWPDLRYGAQARIQAATNPEVDFVMSAIVGVAGLEATYEAIRSGKRVGLANKEVL